MRGCRDGHRDRYLGLLRSGLRMEDFYDLLGRLRWSHPDGWWGRNWDWLLNRLEVNGLCDGCMGSANGPYEVERFPPDGMNKDTAGKTMKQKGGHAVRRKALEGLRSRGQPTWQVMWCRRLLDAIFSTHAEVVARIYYYPLVTPAYNTLRIRCLTMHGGYAAQLSGLSTQAQPRQDHPLGININTQSSSIYAFGTRLPRWGVPDLGPPCAELPVSPDHSLPCATLLADVDIAVAGAIAQTISYPFEVVRQRVQVVGPMEPWQRCAAKFRRDNNDTANSQHKDDSQSNTRQLKILWLPLPQLGNLHQENCVLHFNGARGYGRGLTLVIILDERRGCVECFQHMPMLTTTYAQGRRSDELGWAQSPGCLAVKVASKPSPVTCLSHTSRRCPARSTMRIIFHHLYIPGSSELLVKRIGCATLSHCAIASFAATIPFNTCHEDADGLQPSNQDMYIFWVSFCFLLSLGRPLSPQHLQEVPPMPHPSNPHCHRLACTQTRRYLYPSPPGVHRHRHPVTAPSQHGVQAPLQIPTTPTARKPPCDINSTWHTSPAMTQAANDGGHWRRQQYGDNNNAAMTATVTERLMPLHRHLIRRL
ncbi:hypothetical protein H4582DRAFT_2062266 [Lactarius indigo]|nr:hypothetical protein H4582DRAFT_2062266 [Lactarius indigo]